MTRHTRITLALLVLASTSLLIVTGCKSAPEPDPDGRLSAPIHLPR